MTPGSTGRLVGGRVRALLPTRADLVAMGRAPRRDLLAGLAVAVVALPLALGFGISSGLGAQAGLATAVVAGVLAALFGGSNFQVSGPTGAMTVVLVPITHRFGASGVLTVGLIAGTFLVVLALARAGRAMRYIPMPLVEGFTVGIAAVIFCQQVPGALGVATPHGDKVLAVTGQAIRDFAGHPRWSAVSLAVGVAAVMLVGARWKPKAPFSLIAVAAATILTVLLHLPVKQIGHLPQVLGTPSLAFLHASALGALLPSAVAIAALAALESLLSAAAADAMTVDSHHDPDRELFGQGLANLAAPLFGGVPATGAIARTAVNVRTGATSRLAALTAAAALAVIVLAAAPLVAHIPVAAVAGVLLATAIRMVEVASVRALLRSTGADAAVLVLTAVATVVFNLVTAVIAGLVVAAVLALRAVSNAARIDEVPLSEDAPPADHHGEEAALLDEHIVAYRIEGPLFFGAAHRFLLELADVTDVRVVILRMSRIATIDATGASVLRDAIARLEHRGITVLISGIRDDHHRILDALSVLDRQRLNGHVFATTPEAILFARDIVHHDGPHQPPNKTADAADGQRAATRV